MWRCLVDEQAMPGDAALAAGPMVGGGFRQGLYDVGALAQVLTAMTSAAEIPGTLGRYQELRLRRAAQHVAESEQETAAYLAHATLGK